METQIICLMLLSELLYSMNYKKFYEECTWKRIPRWFHVHHIDHNRDNNDIENLVAIPNDLHWKYHNSCSERSQYIDISAPNKNLWFFQFQWYFIDWQLIYSSSLWIVYREYLMWKFHLIIHEEKALVPTEKKVINSIWIL